MQHRRCTSTSSCDSRCRVYSDVALDPLARLARRPGHHVHGSLPRHGLPELVAWKLVSHFVVLVVPHVITCDVALNVPQQSSLVQDQGGRPYGHNNNLGRCEYSMLPMDSKGVFTHRHGTDSSNGVRQCRLPVYHPGVPEERLLPCPSRGMQ